MPYISVHIRKTIDPHLKALLGRSRLASVGELNYILTTICDNWLAAHALGPKYADFNDIMGMLEAVKLELYRRLVTPYEDAKRAQTGDVYTVGREEEGLDGNPEL